MIRLLSEKEFEQEAKDALLLICGSDHPNPYVTPFNPGMQWKRILCPYNYIPEDNLMALISRLASENGEAGFYLSVYDRPPEVERRFPYHWYIPFDEIANYKKGIGVCKELPTVVFSPNAKWGIIADMEGMGVIGAVKEWGNLMESKLPNPNNDVQEFIKLFKWFRVLAENRKPRRIIDFDWVPKLFEHVYGEDLAKEFLSNSVW
jgi:hypothetical protein